MALDTDGNDALQASAELLGAFAERTGVDGGSPPQRYLWTDAFAVRGFLELHRRTGEARFRDRGLSLVDQVHEVLGRHRDDDERTGWISGLSEDEGRRHPTRGGLRIGKDLPERGLDEPPDPELEWDRDGQYFHYLTKWMTALLDAARTTGDSTHHRHAIELATAAHRAFTVGDRSPHATEPVRMVWKMSIDLTRPVVSSMGHHDPLDGFVSDAELLEGSADSGAADAELSALERAVSELRATCRAMRWTTADALGAGGLLDVACRLARRARAQDADERAIARDVVEDALESLGAVLGSGLFRLPLDRRLPFREIGLAIGLHEITACAEALDRVDHGDELVAEVRRLDDVATAIDATWSSTEGQRGATWTGHFDINAVMLATSLLRAVPEPAS